MMAEILTATHYHILMRVWNFKHLQYERCIHWKIQRHCYQKLNAHG